MGENDALENAEVIETGDEGGKVVTSGERMTVADTQKAAEQASKAGVALPTREEGVKDPKAETDPTAPPKKDEDDWAKKEVAKLRAENRELKSRASRPAATPASTEQAAQNIKADPDLTPEQKAAELAKLNADPIRYFRDMKDSIVKETKDAVSQAQLQFKLSAESTEWDSWINNQPAVKADPEAGEHLAAIIAENMELTELAKMGLITVEKYTKNIYAQYVASRTAEQDAAKAEDTKMRRADSSKIARVVAGSPNTGSGKMGKRTFKSEKEISEFLDSGPESDYNTRRAEVEEAFREKRVLIGE